MPSKKQQEMIDAVRLNLRQIALELQSASEGAMRAAELVPDREGTWPQLQQMYTRLEEANHLVERFKTTINEALSQSSTTQK